MNMRERCERAEAYRKNGANCAQALLAAFADVMGITETQALAVGLWRDLSISTAGNCWRRRNCSPLTRPWHWRRGITAGCLFSARRRYCAG